MNGSLNLFLVEEYAGNNLGLKHACWNNSPFNCVCNNFVRVSTLVSPKTTGDWPEVGCAAYQPVIFDMEPFCDNCIDYHGDLRRRNNVYLVYHWQDHLVLYQVNDTNSTLMVRSWNVIGTILIRCWCVLGSVYWSQTVDEPYVSGSSHVQLCRFLLHSHQGLHVMSATVFL